MNRITDRILPCGTPISCCFGSESILFIRVCGLCLLVSFFQRDLFLQVSGGLSVRVVMGGMPGACCFG